jgi:hypothetical protein
MGELRRRILNDRDLPFRDLAGGELPLRETQIAGAPGGQHAAKPRLLTQPPQHAVAVGRINGESVELSSGAGGTAQALVQHLVAAFRQQLRHPVKRHAAAIRTAEQHQRRSVDIDRVEPVRQQRHSVAGRDHQVALNPHGVRAAWPYAEGSAQKAHRLDLPILRLFSRSTTAPPSRSTVRRF